MCDTLLDTKEGYVVKVLSRGYLLRSILLADHLNPLFISFIQQPDPDVEICRYTDPENVWYQQYACNY